MHPHVLQETFSAVVKLQFCSLGSAHDGSSIPKGSDTHLKADSAFRSSEVGELRTQLVGTVCAHGVACIVKL